MNRTASHPTPSPRILASYRFPWILLLLFLVGSIDRALAAEARLIVASPHNEAIRHEFGQGFMAWHQKSFGQQVRVEWRDLGGSSDILRFVQSEFAAKPDGIGLDIFFGGGPEPYLILSERGLLVEFTPATEILSGIPQQTQGIEVYETRHRWYGAALSSFGILQNLQVQKRMKLPMALKWEDLGAPNLTGWVAAGDPRNSGTMNNMYEAFLQAGGWENGWRLLTRIAGNVKHFDRISTTTAKEVTLGEVAYGFAIDFYGFTQVAAAGRERVTFSLPQDFTSVSPDGIGILKGAPNLETARRFIEFVLGEPGQKLWFLPRGHPEGPQKFSIERMSVRPDFYERYKGISNIEFSPFELKQGFRYDARKAKARRDVVAGLFGATLVDVHAELKKAWERVRARGMREEDLQAFGRMPVDEAEALKIASGPWRDPRTRNRLRNEWQKWAAEKYQGLATLPLEKVERSESPSGLK